MSAVLEVGTKLFSAVVVGLPPEVLRPRRVQCILDARTLTPVDYLYRTFDVFSINKIHLVARNQLVNSMVLLAASREVFRTVYPRHTKMYML